MAAAFALAKQNETDRRVAMGYWLLVGMRQKSGLFGARHARHALTAACAALRASSMPSGGMSR